MADDIDAPIDDTDDDTEALRRAYTALSEQLIAERQTFADHIQALLTERDQNAVELAGLRAERERRIHLESELEAVYNTRTFKTTARVRGWYGKLRRS